MPDLSTVPAPLDTTNALDRIEHTNGLIVYVHEKGKGDVTVAERDYILVRFTGRLTNEEIFISSLVDSQTNPVTLDLILERSNGFPDIEGIPLGLMSMREGEVRTLVIPPSLGYGQRTRNSSAGYAVVPPGSTLIFDIELVGVLD